MSITKGFYNTFSLDHQDEFVLRLFNEFKPGYVGTFLDAGCFHGMHGNNTFTLEQRGWTGALICTHELFAIENSKFRKNPIYLADLSSYIWNKIMESKPKEIDYLSFTPERKEIFQASLEQFPWDALRFGVCTLRHYSSRDGPENRDFARKLLKSHGYILLAGNVCDKKTYSPYEDWFINPNMIPESVYGKYICDSVRAIEVFYKPKVFSARNFCTCSSDLQDEFILRLFTKTNPNFKGTYLDIGCGNGFEGNNTFLLEQAGWSGYLVDLDKEAYEWNIKHRPGSKSFCTDVTTCEWNTLLGKTENETRIFDYISFDVDEATMGAVNNFPWDTVRFRAITIEHDTYRFGPRAREYIRQIMSDKGYLLVCADVCAGFNGGPFEDWFVDPKELDETIYQPYTSMWARAIDVLYEPKA